MESHSAVKRNETETFSDTWIYLETDTQSEVIKSHREAETYYSIPYMWNLKRNDINELTKQKKASQI